MQYISWVGGDVRRALRFDVAAASSQAGDRDRAFEWLAKAVEARDPNSPAIVPDPQFDNLRGDARFRELLRRLNLG